MHHDPKLDGIRAFSAIAVVLYHANVPGFHGGFIGVDVFFVLSGYLITLTLKSNPNLSQFYLRRAKRLIPPLAFMLAVYLMIFPSIFPEYPHLRDTILSFFYLSDYSYALYEFPKYIAHTWTLSVEEHFYLLWPIIFIALKPPTKVLFYAYVIATFWRFGCAPFGWVEAYARFDTRMSGLILGCILAQIELPKMSAWLGMIGLAAGCFILRNGAGAIGLGVVFTEICAAAMILGSKPQWLGWAPIAYVGKLSYGIYLWHYPIIKICNHVNLSWYMTSIVSLALSAALAAISYHAIEVWFRKNNKKSPQAIAVT